MTTGEKARAKIVAFFGEPMPTNIVRNLGRQILEGTTVDDPDCVLRVEMGDAFLRWSEEACRD